MDFNQAFYLMSEICLEWSESFNQGNEGHRLEKFISNRDIIHASADFTRKWVRLRHEIYGGDITEDDIPNGSSFKVIIDARRGGSCVKKIF